jgi:RNA polymerase sigma factor (sigma-70 family)
VIVAITANAKDSALFWRGAVIAFLVAIVTLLFRGAAEKRLELRAPPTEQNPNPKWPGWTESLVAAIGDLQFVFTSAVALATAFGALYTRHAAAARALARQYVKPGDAEDVVADAFSKLYEMLRRGAGPDSGFRTYLYTVVRHRAYDVSRGASRTRPAEDAEIEAALGRVASSEDPALQGFERSVVSRAYFGLPERWREVLWYCLVDDLKPAQVAPVLGLTPNGVSALLYRAKDALRDGYLQQHLTHAPSDTCRAVNPHLGGYVRDSLSRREKARIEATKRGHSVVEQSLPDGSIKLTVTVGGGA